MRDGSGFTLERRDPDTGAWRVIGKYSSELAAATALDEAVGQGQGTLADYRIAEAGTRHSLLRRLTTREH